MSFFIFCVDFSPWSVILLFIFTYLTDKQDTTSTRPRVSDPTKLVECGDWHIRSEGCEERTDLFVLALCRVYYNS